MELNYRKGYFPIPVIAKATGRDRAVIYRWATDPDERKQLVHVKIQRGQREVFLIRGDQVDVINDPKLHPKYRDRGT